MKIWFQFLFQLLLLTSFRENEKWLKQRVPISKYIMMPRKVADYSLPFNEVSLDFISYIREKRGEGNRLSDTVSGLNRWSFECKCFGSIVVVLL